MNGFFNPESLRRAEELFLRRNAEQRAEQEREMQEFDRRLRAATERYRVDPLFHARIYGIASLFELRKAPELDIPELDPQDRYEVFLGMALQSVVAAEMFDEAHAREPRLCGQQHPMIDDGSPCVARGEHSTHVTASGRSWR